MTYKKPYFNVNGWKELFINTKSLNVLIKLYEWRDRIGRELNQSIGCVLSNKIFKQIFNDLRTNNLNKYSLSVISLLGRNLVRIYWILLTSDV